MSLGPFYLFEQPSTPLLVTLRMPDGSAPDLSRYILVELESDGGLPRGNTSATSDGAIQYDLIEPFMVVGRFMLRARLHHANGTELTAATHFDVVGEVATWITPERATYTTGQPTSRDDVIRAGRVISAIVGTDLSNAALRARYSQTDLALLADAVCWQGAAYARESDQRAAGAGSLGGMPLNLPEGVQSVSMDGMSVTLRPGSTSGSLSGLALDPMANRCLLALSTRDTAIYALPVTGGRERPDAWRSL